MKTYLTAVSISITFRLLFRVTTLDMAINVEGILQTQSYRFNWTIERFLEKCEKVGEICTSPVFSIYHSDKITKWDLRMYPKGENEECKDYTAIYLRQQNDEKSDVSAVFQVSIATASGPDIRTLSLESPRLFKQGNSWGWKKFVMRDFIIDPNNGALVDGAITIKCEIKFPSSTQDATEKLEAYSNLVDKIGKGFGDYEQLLKTNQFSDVMFIVQDKRIYLHKDILMCRNSFFKAMLKNQSLEKKRKLAKDEHEIKDVDYKVMMEVFRFIYAGKVNNIDKIVKKLLIAADRFDVDDLKALCELTLARNLLTDLTVNNVLEYLELVDKCDTAHLTTPVINFAVLHYGEVIKKPGFKDLSNSVMFRIMQKIKPAI